jgi:G patch domain-containing protein 1
MLGEIGLRDQRPRSVFDYLSEKDRARLQSLAVRDSSDSSLSPASPTPAKTVIPTVDPVIAQAALRGFQPFTNKKEKQFRYTTYLRSQLAPSTSTESVAPPERKSGQSLEDYNHELEEYAKSAMIFKPMSGAMANRFTSAAIVETGPDIQEGLHMTTPSSSIVDTANSTKLPDKIEVEETPKQHAARLGMYGPLTREIRDWPPARLLCKRFGVKDPRPGPNPDARGSDTVLSTQTQSWGDTVAASAVAQPEPDVGPARSVPRDISNIGLGEDDDQGRDTLTYQRPALDIFKAIFASDAEDSDDDQEANAPITPSAAPTALAVSTPSNALSAAPEALAPDIENQQPVDLASFKPKFVPKSHRDREGKSSPGGKAAQRSDKHRKSENKLKQSLVSFGADDDAESMNIVVISNTKKEKEKKKRVREDEEEEKELKRARSAMTAIKSTFSENEADEWVEKTPPPVPRKLTPKPVDGQPLRSKDPHRPIRPKASDFL